MNDVCGLANVRFSGISKSSHDMALLIQHIKYMRKSLLLTLSNIFLTVFLVGCVTNNADKLNQQAVEKIPATHVMPENDSPSVSNADENIAIEQLLTQSGYDPEEITKNLSSAGISLDILPVSYTHLTLPTTPYV